MSEMRSGAVPRALAHREHSQLFRERWLSSRVVATLLVIVPLLLLEPTRRPLLSGLQAQRFRVRLEDNMTIIKGSDGSWTWNGGKDGAQRFDELAQAEALAKFGEQRQARAGVY